MRALLDSLRAHVINVRLILLHWAMREISLTHEDVPEILRQIFALESERKARLRT